MNDDFLDILDGRKRINAEKVLARFDPVNVPAGMIVRIGVIANAAGRMNFSRKVAKKVHDAISTLD